MTTKNQLLSILDSIELIYQDEYEYFDTDIKKNKAIYKLSYDFYKDVEKLFQLHCVVKDIDKGFVDIFTQVNDQVYLFCWNVHEDKVDHWHEVFEDCCDRKSLALKVNK